MNAPVFLSLGSQYDWNSGLAVLDFGEKGDLNRQELTQELESRFSGKAVLTNKGRDAIEILLKSLKNKDRKVVFMQGFACYAIEEAIAKAGYTPGFVDTGDKSVNLDLAQIKKAQKKYGLPSALILQHTFGVPTKYSEIRDWCQQNQVALIDDLAQSFGATDENGKKLGVLADGVICSFGRDKVIDSVTGGALVAINQDYFDLEVILASEKNLVSPRKTPRLLDSIYPILTLSIRKTYGIGIGKIIHALAKKTGILKSPLYSRYDRPTKLSENFARLALKNLKNLDLLANHRREISKIYFEELRHQKNIKVAITSEEISNGANLRFPIWVENPRELIDYLAKSNIYISDRWYRDVIDCSSIKCDSSYKKGDCPNAEKISQKAVQLPTHEQIDAKTAHKIASLVKDYYGKS